jgi:hypothetical protein
MTSSIPTTTQAAGSADRRILALLDGYAALAGGSLTVLEPDLYQLTVPKGDEARFGGRSVVRVAFTVEALELDDRAEMAIVGSSFVNELIDAIRERGARLFSGWIVPDNADATSPPRLPAAVRNGTAVPTAVAFARHRVGRLTARVAIRAGTELRERLADSTLYDLCSGIPLAPDVIAASEVAAPTDEIEERWRSVESTPTQRLQSLVARMIADLEQRLRPEIEQVASLSQRALVNELLRIESYYSAMLEDIGGRGSGVPDADSRRAIEAENRRRTEEERDRHAVRAVVHPLQLTEWELIVQRATWRLETRDGHAASVSAQRTLAGASGWTFACDTCGASPPDGLTVCLHDHVACDACSSTCAVCDRAYCREHGIARCHVDDQPACDEHARNCRICRRDHCTAHEGTCFDGAHEACLDCLGPCASCGRIVCESHASFSGPDAPRGARRFCHTCSRTCEGGTGEIVGPDEVTACASCERVVCEHHQSRCAIDGKVHCSKHLRRTDRSRRLVCENDRATCSCEPNAVFARDEVRSCVTCGKINCDQHLVACVVDGQQHCPEHVRQVNDGPGSFACAEHRSACHVDGRQYTIEGTAGCPCCGRLACAAHTRKCERCGRGICTTDYSAARPKVCATCVKLAPESDPSDEIIAAAIELRGEAAPLPKRWSVARDARHILVDLDLGWTRRLTMAIPHGQARAEHAVAHSALGSRVLR